MRGGNLTIELLALCATALRDLNMGYQHREIAANSGHGLDVLLADAVAHLRGLGIDDEGGWDCEATRGIPVAAGDQSSLTVPVPACPEDADDASQEMNAWRAQIGAEILKAHTRMKREKGETPEALDLASLLADLRHMADAAGLDFYRALGISYQHYLEEKAVPA